VLFIIFGFVNGILSWQRRLKEKREQRSSCLRGQLASERREGVVIERKQDVGGRSILTAI
jgi:hypothetical protein